MVSDHDDQVDMIIDELLNIEWVWTVCNKTKHPKTNEPMYHLMRKELIDIKDNIDIISKSYTYELTNPVCKNKDVESMQLTQRFKKVRLSLPTSCICPECTKIVTDNPFRYSNFKIYEITNMNVYFYDRPKSFYSNDNKGT